MTGVAEPRRASAARVAALLALYLTTVAASGVVHLTPTGDPLWAIIVAAVGCLLIASGSLVGQVAACSRAESIAKVAEATSTGMIATSFACGLLLSLAVQGHYPSLMFSCLAAAALLGFGPVPLVRRRQRRMAHR